MTKAASKPTTKAPSTVDARLDELDARIDKVVQALINSRTVREAEMVKAGLAKKK